VWDVATQTGRVSRSASALNPGELEQFWTDLASSDARKAHEAIWALAASPGEAVPFLRRHLQSVPAIPAERLRQLVSDLDSPRFKDREAASHELAELDEQAERALADALKAKPSAETRRRIETLLDRPRLARKPEVRRGLRSIEVL